MGLTLTFSILSTKFMGQLIIKDDMSRSSAEGNDCQRFNGEYGHKYY
jgi:hypothetical protein